MKRSALLVFVIAVTSICSGQWLERQVVIGDTFGGIYVDSEEGEISVNPVSGSVYIQSEPIQVFNPVTMEKLHGPGATGLIIFCPPSGKGYVLGDSALVIDATADTVIGAVALPFTPDACAYSPTSNRLYAASMDNESLVVFDPDGDTVLQIVDVRATVQSLLWDSTWNRLYVGTGLDSGWLEVYDCVADSLVAEIRLGLRDVSLLGLSPASSKLYCGGYPDTAVFIVSTESLTTIGTVPGLRPPDAMLYCPATNRMFCPEVYYGLSIFDCEADTVRTWIEMQDLFSMTVSVLSGRAYLGREDSSLVMVVDTTDSIVGSLPIPTVPNHEIIALTFDPGRNQVYGVTAPGDVAFSIDASVDTLMNELSYANYLPRQMVHNPAGNKLYLLCPSHDEVLVMDSTFGPPKHILRGAISDRALPVLNPALNRLYVVDTKWIRIIDCNSDNLVRAVALTDCRWPRPVMVPYLNKVYVFDSYVQGGPVYAYDCLRDTAVLTRRLSSDVPCAVYDPRSNRVFFSGGMAALCALSPVTDSIVKTFDLGNAYRANIAINLDLGRLYFTHQLPSRLFTIDLLTDSVIASESLPWGVDSMLLNRRLGKLFMCSRDTTQVLVLDCGQGKIVDTFDVGFPFVRGLMDDRNDKLYLRYGVVVDCGHDSVMSILDSFSPTSMAWDAIDNRVFQATTSRLYVYRDVLTGVDADPITAQERRHATIVRGILALPVSPRPRASESPCLLDACGRKVLDLTPGRNDVRSLPAGVYFVKQMTGNRTTKVVIQR